MNKKIGITGVIAVAVILFLGGCSYVQLALDTLTGGEVTNKQDDNARDDLSNLAYAMEYAAANSSTGYPASLEEIIAIETSEGGIKFTPSEGVRNGIANDEARSQYLLVAESRSGRVFYRMSSGTETYMLNNEQEYLASPPLMEGIVNPPLR